MAVQFYTVAARTRKHIRALAAIDADWVVEPARVACGAAFAPHYDEWKRIASVRAARAAYMHRHRELVRYRQRTALGEIIAEAFKPAA